MLSAEQSWAVTKSAQRLARAEWVKCILAQDMKLDRQVAIKFLSRNSTTETLANKRLLREAQAAAKLDHPNICAVHEVPVNALPKRTQTKVPMFHLPRLEPEDQTYRASPLPITKISQSMVWLAATGGPPSQ
jgi:serine/threonine protein kinase